MAARLFYQEDCNLSLLEGKKIAIIGYGSQGHAHALNLKDSGCDVIIGLYEGSKSWAKAEAQGFKVYTAAEAAKQADIIMILINDEKQAAMYKKDIEPNLEDTSTRKPSWPAGPEGFLVEGACRPTLSVMPYPEIFSFGESLCKTSLCPKIKRLRKAGV